jgi:hypothetical protein
VRFLDFPDYIQNLSLMMDSTLGAPFIAISVMQVLTLLCSLFEGVRRRAVFRTLAVIALIVTPIVTISLLFIAGLPKA